MSFGFKSRYVFSSTLLDKDGLRSLCVVNKSLKRECECIHGKDGEDVEFRGNTYIMMTTEVIHSLEKKTEIKINNFEVIRYFLNCAYSPAYSPNN